MIRRLFLDVRSVPPCSKKADHRLVMAKINIKRLSSKRRANLKRYKWRKLNEFENVLRDSKRQ